MKKALIFIGLGLACCGTAILYARFLSQTGSQPVFITLYLSGVAVVAFSTASLVFNSLRPRPKFLSVSSAIASFAFAVVLLLSPFYMIR